MPSSTPHCQRRRRALLPTLLLACAALAGCGEPAPRRPNVLLISIDTLRADHLGCYGYQRPTSPHIDALASAGVRCERAVSTTSWTLPAHLSLLTGLPISAHGICEDRLWDRHRPDGTPIPPPLRGSFVSEDLQRAGYATAGFYTWKYLDDQFGFGPGFETWERLGYDFFSHPEVGARFLELKRADDVEGMKRLAAEHPDLLDPRRRSSPETVDRALAWLEQPGRGSAESPFFLFVHLFDVHDPYLPPPEYDRFGDPAYAGPIDGTRVTSPDSPVRGDMAPADLARLIALYDGGIAFVDSEVGRLLARLEVLGLARDTLVILTSDHGEEFYDHGHKTHRRQLHVESVSVPLILRWPAGLRSGRTITGTVGLIDVVPTILAAAGTAGASPRPGTELLGLARGERPNEPRVYSTLLDLFEAGALSERQVGLWRGSEHLLWSHAPGRADQLQLYELAHDPRERAGTELVPASAEAATWMDRVARLREAYAGLRARSPERGAELPPLSELDKSQLAALGYVGLDEEAESQETSEKLCLDGCVWE